MKKKKKKNLSKNVAIFTSKNKINNNRCGTIKIH